MTAAPIVPRMPSLWRQNDLPELVTNLARRPGHEAIRGHITDILRHGFGAAYGAPDHEVRMPEVRGRADMLFGATVFEFKADLRREMGDVAARLPEPEVRVKRVLWDGLIGEAYGAPAGEDYLHLKSESLRL